MSHPLADALTSKAPQSRPEEGETMTIVSRLDYVMADRKISSKELAARLGITPVSLSRMRTGRTKQIRLAILEGLCRELDCQPGDLFVLRRDVAPAIEPTEEEDQK